MLLARRLELCDGGAGTRSGIQQPAAEPGLREYGPPFNDPCCLGPKKPWLSKVKNGLKEGSACRCFSKATHFATNTHNQPCTARCLLQARAHPAVTNNSSSSRSIVAAAKMSEGLRLGDKDSDVHSYVSKYYGETLQGSSDLKTSACCTSKAPSAEVRRVLAQLPQDITSRCAVGEGCGTLTPPISCTPAAAAMTPARLLHECPSLPLLLLLLLQVLWLRIPLPSWPAGLRPACAGPGVWHRAGLLRVRSAGGADGFCHR